MSERANKEPTYYNSLYQHGVDEKRRVQIPAKWRPDKSGHGTDVDALAEGIRGRPCLRVLPPAEMAKMVKAIDAMSNGDPNKGF
jgi:DNA-binding transcriptional regulator/RsmH inhibitor MraZ